MNKFLKFTARRKGNKIIFEVTFDAIGEEGYCRRIAAEIVNAITTT